MIYDEFKKLDEYNAFAEFISVSQAKSSGIIPESFHNIFQDKCKCGSDFIISENLTQLQCCDPRCKIKMGHTLADILARFDCKNLGPATCLSIMSECYDKLKYKSPVEVLMMDLKDYPPVLSGLKGGDFYEAVENIRRRKLSLPELVSNLNIPSWDKSIKDIMENYNSIDEFITDMNSYANTPTFLAKFGIHDLKKSFYLERFIPELYLAEAWLHDNIRSKAVTNVNICVTGSVSPNGISMTKKQFIDLLNDVAITKDGIQLYSFNITDAVSSVPYVVADYPTSHRKYIRGRERGVLITSTELINKIREVITSYDEG